MSRQSRRRPTVPPRPPPRAAAEAVGTSEGVELQGIASTDGLSKPRAAAATAIIASTSQVLLNASPMMQEDAEIADEKSSRQVNSAAPDVPMQGMAEAADMPRELVAPRNAGARTLHAVGRTKGGTKEEAEDGDNNVTNEVARITRSPRAWLQPGTCWRSDAPTREPSSWRLDRRRRRPWRRL